MRRRLACLLTVWGVRRGTGLSIDGVAGEEGGGRHPFGNVIQVTETPSPGRGEGELLCSLSTLRERVTWATCKGGILRLPRLREGVTWATSKEGGYLGSLPALRERIAWATSKGLVVHTKGRVYLSQW